MHHYRTVGYVDDGCYHYQCLTCKSSWVGRNLNVLYCPYCGRAIDHVKTRPTDIPRWQWERWGEDIPTEVRDKIYLRPAPAVSRLWVFEYRYKWTGQEWGEWTFDSKIRDNHCTHQLARSWLAHLRVRSTKEEDSPFQIVWRVRRLTAAQVAEYVRTGRYHKDQ